MSLAGTTPSPLLIRVLKFTLSYINIAISTLVWLVLAKGDRHFEEVGYLFKGSLSFLVRRTSVLFRSEQQKCLGALSDPFLTPGRAMPVLVISFSSGGIG